MSTRMIALAPLQGRGAQRLIIASHRGPVEYELSQEQTLRPQRGVGGVVTALLAADSHRETTWVALAMTNGDRLAVQHARQDGGPLPSPLPGQSMHLHYVAIPAAAYRKYSEQISNHLLWFFHHYLPVPRWDAAGRLQEAWTNGYVVANRAIADAVCQEIDREATAPIVMLHDYQLYLAADIIRQRRPTVVMQQFIHIPWPEVPCSRGPWLTSKRERSVGGVDVPRCEPIPFRSRSQRSVARSGALTARERRSRSARCWESTPSCVLTVSTRRKTSSEDSRPMGSCSKRILNCTGRSPFWRSSCRRGKLYPSTGVTGPRCLT